MRMRWRKEVCLGLLLSRTCCFLWKRVHKRRFLLDIQGLWVVLKKAICDTDIEDVYVVGLGDDDEDSEDEDLDGPHEVASTSSSDLQTQLAPSPPVTQAQSSNSSNLAPHWCSHVSKAVL